MRFSTQALHYADVQLALICEMEQDGLFDSQMTRLLSDKMCQMKNLKQDQVHVRHQDLLSFTENLMEPHLQNYQELPKLDNKEYLSHHG